jgi:hypothetical protein
MKGDGKYSVINPDKTTSRNNNKTQHAGYSCIKAAYTYKSSKFASLANQNMLSFVTLKLNYD